MAVHGVVSARMDVMDVCVRVTYSNTVKVSDVNMYAYAAFA